MKLDFPLEKVDRIKARCAEWIEEIIIENTDSPIFFLKKESILAALQALKTEEGLEYNFLSDITAYDDNPPLSQVADYGLGALGPERPGIPRFVVVYQLLSLHSMERIRLKVRVADGDSIASAVSLWKAANWLEREVFDMYGVKFSGHPNLRRILMDDRWIGHPQRKDYPIKRYQRFEGASTMEHLGLELKK